MTESARTPLPGATNGCSCCAPAADATAPAGHQSADPTGTSAGDATYQVEGMTCDGCAAAVCRAIQRLDPEAKVAVDLDHGRVAVTTTAQALSIAEALNEAGYTASAMTG